MNKIFDRLTLIVGEKNMLTEQKELAKYSKDWRGFYNNKSLCVVFPINTKTLKEIVIFCFENDIKIVPQGGNTSLTGASVPTYKSQEIIINFSKMNKILEIDKSNLTVLVEAGLILDNLKENLDKEGLYFPINISSSGSCMIGGNIATNAGGINALKYGTMKDNLIGIEMITGNGTLLSNLSKMKKNNTGYNLKSIVSSSEGTLGMISKALLKIYPKPTDSFTFFVAYENLNLCIESFKQIRNIYYDKLESAELIPNYSFEVCLKNKFINKHFFKTKNPWYVMYRLNLYENKLNFQNIFENNYPVLDKFIKEILIPTSIEQENKIWKFRDDLVEAYKMEGKVVTNDISIPLDKIDIFFKTAASHLNKIPMEIKLHPFGHLGDNNIHFNMVLPNIEDLNLYIKIRDEIYLYINDLVQSYGGSFSAEHGIGQIKKDSLLKYKTSSEIEIMKNIKKIFDPKNILNDGKIFD
ncbi:FAD-binding oxidoreductase [Alphaproteobacteria bacterium]|nr:FAD-binding oxidoreductase [Alphaproteobacteria bacterium]